MEKGALSNLEIKTLEKLLKKVPALPRVPRELFIPLMSKNVPVAIELAPVSNGKVLLAYRNDAFYKGWHFPGSFMIPGETFEESCKRIISNEIGLRVKKISLMFIAVSPRNKRFPLAHILFRCDVSGTAKRGEWFSKMPKDIIASHVRFWKALSASRNKKLYSKRINGDYLILSK